MRSWRIAAVLLLGLALAGCGRAELWTRWRAERMFWHAGLLDARVRAAGSGVTASSLHRARAAFLGVAATYPATRWLPRAAAGDTLARDVARVSATAVTRAALLAAQAGDTTAARAELEANARTYAALWPSGFEAWIALAGLYESVGESLAAAPAWESAARRGWVVDPDSARVSVREFTAATRVAEAQRHAGRTTAVDSLWGAMTVAIDAALRAHTGDSLAPVLWLRRGDAGLARGGLQGWSSAAASYRNALAEPAGAPFAVEAMRGLGEAALASGERDTALVWARRAQAISPLPLLVLASDLETRIWEAEGRLDSAAAGLDRLAETRHLPLGVATDARYREGLTFERMNRWESARTVFHSVIASDPLAAVSFEAIERLVRHPLDQHETEVVDEEGDWSLDQLTRTLATVRDPAVRVMAYRARARVLEMMGDDAGALDAWETSWKEYPRRPEGVEAGFTAAALAIRLKDPERAFNLYDGLARSAPRAATRDSARAAADALRRTGR